MAEITRSRVGINTYLAPQGSLSDALTLEALQLEVQNCIDNSENQLIIDLDNVPTLNSRILELLLEWQDQLFPRGGHLTLVKANPVNLDVLNITELSHYINIVSQMQTVPVSPDSDVQKKGWGICS